LDGFGFEARMIDTYSEEWRMECEARHVLNMRLVVDRRAYLERVEKVRGVEARNALAAVLKDLWGKRKAEK
jgi:hypothetical protein